MLSSHTWYGHKAGWRCVRQEPKTLSLAQNYTKTLTHCSAFSAAAVSLAAQAVAAAGVQVLVLLEYHLSYSGYLSHPKIYFYNFFKEMQSIPHHILPLGDLHVRHVACEDVQLHHQLLPIDRKLHIAGVTGSHHSPTHHCKNTTGYLHSGSIVVVISFSLSVLRSIDSSVVVKCTVCTVVTSHCGYRRDITLWTVVHVLYSTCLYSA